MTEQSDRKRLERRSQEHLSLANHIVPKRLQKSPSQKKSETGRKKFLKRAGKEKQEPVPILYDCHTCPKYPCGQTMATCDEPAITHRCMKCGKKVTYRFDPLAPWEYCPVCKVKVKT